MDADETATLMAAHNMGHVLRTNSGFVGNGWDNRSPAARLDNNYFSQIDGAGVILDEWINISPAGTDARLTTQTYLTFPISTNGNVAVEEEAIVVAMGRVRNNRAPNRELHRDGSGNGGGGGGNNAGGGNSGILILNVDDIELVRDFSAGQIDPEDGQVNCSSFQGQNACPAALDTIATMAEYLNNNILFVVN